MTDRLRAALVDTASQIRRLDLQSAADTAAALTALQAELAAPYEITAGLQELDSAVISMLQHLPEYVRLATREELQQSLRQLRRMLLSDRRRVDPDPARQSLSLALCTRQAQLIEHQSAMLTSLDSITHTRQKLSSITDDGEYALTLKHLRLLESYCVAHDEFIQHLQSEINQLRTEYSR